MPAFLEGHIDYAVDDFPTARKHCFVVYVSLRTPVQKAAHTSSPDNDRGGISKLLLTMLVSLSARFGRPKCQSPNACQIACRRRAPICRARFTPAGSPCPA